MKMKKTTKKFLVMMLALVMTTYTFVGCSKSTENADTTAEATTAPVDNKESETATDTTTEGGRTFAYCTSTLNNPFMTTIGDALKEACEKNGDKLITFDPQYDQSKQISQVEDAINQGVAGIFLLAVDSNGVKTVLKEAAEKNIPVIAIDNPVTDTDLVAANVASDNVNAGYIIGQAMLADFPDGAKIAIIDSPTMQACVDRFDGFIKAIEEAGKKDKFEIVAQQDGTASLEKSMPIAENMIQANPDIQAFYGINDPTALGVIATLKAADKLEGIKVYGVDGSPDGKAAIKEGTLAVTAAQSPISLANTSYDNMLKVLNGETIEKSIAVDTFKIDASNLDQYGVDGWQ
jgi:ribose transport system substrate-binding protein